MKPVAIDAYKTSDGEIFEQYNKAKEHQLDIIGELLDNFLPYDDRGNVTRSDRHNILMKQLEDEKLPDKIKSLYNAIWFSAMNGG